MTNPYLPPEERGQRVFKTPIIMPLSVIMVIVIYAGYSVFFITDQSVGVIEGLKTIAFELFLLCEFGLVSLLLYNRSQLQSFLNRYPAIDSSSSLEALKPIARTNMYSALFSLLFLGVGSLTAIISILHGTLLNSLIVVVLTLLASVVMARYTPLENRVKQIECLDSGLEGELNALLHCWMNKALPNF